MGVIILMFRMLIRWHLPRIFALWFRCATFCCSSVSFFFIGASCAFYVYSFWVISSRGDSKVVTARSMLSFQSIKYQLNYE